MAAEDKSDGGVVAIVGAGPGNGDAFARRFARAGQPVALLARTLERLERSPAQISGAKPFACDVTDPGSIVLSLDAVARELGPIETVIYNAGKGVWGDPASISPADFEEMWRVNAFEAFLVARHVIPSMVSHGRGEIIFIGATASKRGGAQTAAFASAKGAQHHLAESLARAYGPKGVHVALLVLDAVVGEPPMRKKMPNKPTEFFGQSR